MKEPNPPGDAGAISTTDTAGGASEDSSDLSVFSRPLQRLTVEFRIHRYSAPKGTFTNDGELWKLVTGPLPDAASTLRLADNGFRAAVGLESDREPLRDFLSRVPGLQSVLDQATPDVSRSVELELGSCPPRLVVFYYGVGGTLRGMDFVEAKAKLRLWFELRSVNLRDLRLMVEPELAEPPGEPRWVITEEGARQVPEERGRRFTELGFAALVPDGGFLLLGPTAAVYDRPLLGRPFFTQEEAPGSGRTGDARESIYVISAIVRPQEGRGSLEGSGSGGA